MDYADLALGKPASYTATYTPSLLQSIPRAPLREPLGIDQAKLPFHGVDSWTSYEFSWINRKGRPEVAVMLLQVPASSPHIIESKSLKLYLGSFNQTRFTHRADVHRTLESDLMLAVRAPVAISLIGLDQLEAEGIGPAAGACLDHLDVEVEHYDVRPELLHVESDVSVRQSLYSHLLRSCCPVTGQPDWGTVFIQYAGRGIHHGDLLRYIISFRNHSGFHEETVERMFMDLLRRCEPDALTVQARYLRRGGIEINPFRSTRDEMPTMVRMARQ
ncbi:MAG: NADPH-dependent 7-cyano-7-deazaguanine reductase QueF [Gammaproteobacteria bacterium]|nr:MAG: NADPH-dependent 7-cyano-7-deazaguanine reductase QueF [Gammaproteobacteria bacterium]